MASNGSYPAMVESRLTARRAAAALAAWALLAAGAPPIAFVPAGPTFAEAADSYQRIWEEDRDRIVAAMESATGLAFPTTPVEAIVSETRAMTAYHGREMRLRASYGATYKRATLVHEVGHLLTLTLPRNSGLDDHRLLYLFLYDVWTDLYGESWAERMVDIERQIGPEYAEAWDWALAMTREQRQARLRSLRARLPYDAAALS